MPKSKRRTEKNTPAPVIMSRTYHRHLKERAFFSDGEETIQGLIDDAVKAYYHLDDEGNVIKKDKFKKVS